ncbi:MAG: WXG100 family type VII secretion target [Lachnospiraceae bacterium]|nr:WXG100 family type VII secretion target [Lachnospiraceae bacterium]
MEGILRVTPEKLKGAAGEFSGTSNTIKAITDEMMAVINSLKGSWQGEASEAYTSRFNQLQDDMDRIYRMVNEHVKDLNDMADEYIKAENMNVETGNALKGDVIQ